VQVGGYSESCSSRMARHGSRFKSARAEVR
jgi:hypothetical protein